MQQQPGLLVSLLCRPAERTGFGGQTFRGITSKRFRDRLLLLTITDEDMVEIYVWNSSAVDPTTVAHF
jgi:hypothetical protein